MLSKLRVKLADANDILLFNPSELRMTSLIISFYYAQKRSNV